MFATNFRVEQNVFRLPILQMGVNNFFLDSDGVYFVPGFFGLPVSK